MKEWPPVSLLLLPGVERRRSVGGGASKVSISAYARTHVYESLISLCAETQYAWTCYAMYRDIWPFMYTSMTRHLYLSNLAFASGRLVERRSWLV